MGPARRGGERGAAEKKIAILEHALRLHPGSDELLLALLRAVRGGSMQGERGALGGGPAVAGATSAAAGGCVHSSTAAFARGCPANCCRTRPLPCPAPQAEAVCDEQELERRWRWVLARHGGSARLWRAYLAGRRARFAGFRARELAAAYNDALGALRREHRRRAAQGARGLRGSRGQRGAMRVSGGWWLSTAPAPVHSVSAPPPSHPPLPGAPASALAPLEADAAALALEGTALRLAAGATEAAVAALAALLEFNCFSPEGAPLLCDCPAACLALLALRGGSGCCAFGLGQAQAQDLQAIPVNGVWLRATSC